MTDPSLTNLILSPILFLTVQKAIAQAMSSCSIGTMELVNIFQYTQNYVETANYFRTENGELEWET